MSTDLTCDSMGVKRETEKEDRERREDEREEDKTREDEREPIP